MRFSLVLAALLVEATNIAAYTPTPQSRNAWGGPLRSTVEVCTETEVTSVPVDEIPPIVEMEPASVGTIAGVSAPEAASIVASYHARLKQQLEKLRQKDQTSRPISKEELKVVYEDEHIVVVDKTAGTLCVPNGGNPSVNQAVFDAFGCESGQMDRMVVHRLGMDTSGLVVFARTEAGMRGMNSLFRTRKVSRKYEALVCGHLEKDAGVIDLPLMRDYEFPPFMRVSTDEKQRDLVGLEKEDVGRKLLQGPKESITKYEVICREELGGHPVTRVTLTSISGRTHQLNVHCAAFGHPIVADTVYGFDGDAAHNGGLAESIMDATAPNRASLDLQKKISQAVSGMSMCVHAKSIAFKHPVTKEPLSFESEPEF